MSDLDAAIRDLARRTPVTETITITEYVNMLGGTGRGGGTRRASEGLGVSMREIQRYLNAESGAGKQSRRPPAVRIERASSESAVRRRLMTEGAVVTHIHYTDEYDDDRERDVSRPVELDAEALLNALAAPEGTRDRAFGQEFIAAYFGGTQDVRDVGQIRLEFAD